VKVIVLAVVLLAGVFLGFRTTTYATSADGRCMLEQQPGIIIGQSPHFLVQAECALSVPVQPSAPTQPVNQLQPAQQDPPPAVPESGYSLPPGVTRNPGGGFLVNCWKAQCTTEPGAGPDGTTCTQPHTGEQVCR
jgi:hypothetical protein